MRTKLMIFLLLICSSAIAQGKKVLKEPEIFESRFILFGLSSAQLLEKVKDRIHKEAAHQSYIHVEDLRFENKMYLSTYEYFFEKDTIYTVAIKPTSWENWLEEISKTHEYIGDEKKSDRKIAHKFVSKDGRYKLSVYETTSYSNNIELSMQAFPN